MNNIGSLILNHNRTTAPNTERVHLNSADNQAANDEERSNSTTHRATRDCNCRIASRCPLDNRCLQRALVYRADVALSDGTSSTYVGLTAGTFKSRYTQHMYTFRHRTRRTSTSLSRLVWRLKDAGVEHPQVRWSVVARARAYNGRGTRCNLCSTEKLKILTLRARIMNKRGETFSKCRHRGKFKLSEFTHLPIPAQTEDRLLTG